MKVDETDASSAENAAIPKGESFSAFVCAEIGWYVYALRDPRDRKVFYVGKGKSNRVFNHANDARAADTDGELSEKLGLIRQIHDAGYQVEAFIVRHGLPTEETAYDVEASVIDILTLLDPDMSNSLFGLTNQQSGHHKATRGLASVTEIASFYDPPPAPPITVPALLIKIPGLWRPAMDATALYNATRQWWKLGDRRHQARYAFSVNHGVIREVYRIDAESWTPTLVEGKTRWGFSGAVDAELAAKYRNTSVRHLHKPGAANPIRYLNCKRGGKGLLRG